MKKAIFNWSGGKDSSLCLYKIQQAKEYDVSLLVTSVNSQFQRVSMHGVRRELLKQQAESIGLPLFELMMPEMPTMEVYNDVLTNTLYQQKENGVHYSIFGDIFLEDLRIYREKQVSNAGMEAVFPLWKIPTTELVKEFINLGFKAVIVCVNEKYLDKSFAGRIIDDDFLKDLPKNVDPCGENGEYHSFVFDGPIYKTPIDFTLGEIVYKNYQPVKSPSTKGYDCSSTDIDSGFDPGFWYCDLIPINEK